MPAVQSRITCNNKKNCLFFFFFLLTKTARLVCHFSHMVLWWNCMQRSCHCSGNYVTPVWMSLMFSLKLKQLHSKIHQCHPAKNKVRKQTLHQVNHTLYELNSLLIFRQLAPVPPQLPWPSLNPTHQPQQLSRLSVTEHVRHETVVHREWDKMTSIQQQKGMRNVS